MLPKTFTPEELVDRNVKDAKRLLASAVKNLRQSGCIVEDPQITALEDGSFLLELITNNPSKFVFSDHQKVLKHLSLIKTSVNEGFYDWGSQMYIKPDVNCIVQPV
jgi:Tfp pilus assembly protein PilZ